MSVTSRHVQLRVRAAAPEDGFGRPVDTAIALLIIADVTAIMLESVAAIGAKYHSEFFAFEVFSVAVFSVEYVARLMTSPAAGATRREAFAAMLRYVFSIHGLIDLVAIAPFYLSMLGPADLRFLRALCLFRILKLTRYSPAMTML
ncbi:MAG: ion transporter [Gammaproteobacteria bacterium]